MQLKWSPSQIITIGFLVTILVGSFLLYLPISSASGQHISFVDALFTSTSATCVTGLIVLDTGKDFSYFGQGVILLLIQIGALGIMTLTTLFAILIGKRISLSNRIILQNSLGVLDMEGVLKLLFYIIKFTFITEFIGALLLFIRFRFAYHLPNVKALYLSVFHSISAFCNAGFSTFSDNLLSYKGDVVINVVIMLLIILGGLGFAVLFNINISLLNKKKASTRNLSLQTRMVLVATGVLIVIPAILILLIEWNNTLANDNLFNKILGALFQSVTTRTAGFNTIDIGQLHYATLFLMMLLMFIGASPGGTGGGVKTTTVFILFSSVKSILHNRQFVDFHERTIPTDIVGRALSVLVLYASMFFVFLFLMLLAERNSNMNFAQIAFETLSAQGTVGLSMGITNKLSIFGKIIITITMYTGRIGPFTLALAVGSRKKTGEYQYPEEGVMIG